MKHNPVNELNHLHCDFIIAASMIETVIEVCMVGECSSADIGNSLVILKEFIDKRVELMELQNRKLSGLSGLYKDTISNKEILEIYEEYLSSIKNKDFNESTYNKVYKMMDLLLDDKKEVAKCSIREIRGTTRKNGFIEGFKAAYQIIINMEVVCSG